MTLSAIRKTSKNCWDILRASRLILILLLSSAVMMGQVFPMQAGHLRLGDSGLIEICGGENGSYFIQAGQTDDDSKPNHDCNDCSLCASAGNGENIVPASGNGLIQHSVFVDFPLVRGSNVFIDRPEKYWSLSRAPPNKSINRIPALRTSVFLKPLRGDFSEGVHISQAGTS